jgi:hypothetical protein
MHQMMDLKTIEKVLNQLSEERIQDSHELNNLRTVQEMQQESFRESQDEIRSLGSEMKSVKTAQETLLNRMTIPSKQIEALGVKIDAHSELLKTPLMQKVIHEYHIPKLLYVTLATFCICICLAVGWFQANRDLGKYRNNDTKWRKLLLGAKPTLTKTMYDITTAVDNDPEKARESVEKEERHNQKVWDLHQKMLADSAEMSALKSANPGHKK